MANQKSTLPSYVLHVFGDSIIRMQLDDNRYYLPPGEPVEIPEGEFYATKLVEQYGPVYGLVHVTGARTKTGYSIDTDAAIKQAQARLKEVDTDLLMRWVRDQQDDRLKGGLPALPPTGRVEQIIRENKIDLKARFGFIPSGWEMDGGPGVTSAKPVDQSELEDLRNQLKAKDARIEELTAKSDADKAATDDRLRRLEESLGIEPDEPADTAKQ